MSDSAYDFIRPPEGASLPQAVPAALPYASFVIPNQRRVWPVFVLFFLCLVGALIAAAVALVGMILWQHGPGGLHSKDVINSVLYSPLGTNLTLIAVETVLLSGALLAAWCSATPLVQRLRLQSCHQSLFSYLFMLLGMLAVGQVMESTMVLLDINPGQALNHLAKVFSGLQGSTLLLTMLVVGLTAGFSEELLCRGYIQTRLSQRWGAWPAILITSILFGVLHLDPVHSPLAFIMGLYLGIVAEKTGSIRPAIFCHVVNNMSSVYLSATFSEGLSRETHLRLLGIAIIVATLAIAHLIRLKRSGD